MTGYVKNSDLKTRYFSWFFVLYAIWGFYTLPDYGVPMDELTQRSIGIANNQFLSTGSSDAMEAHGLFGPVFESISYLLEQLVYSQPLTVKIYLRHALLFSIFLFSLYLFYRIAQFLLNDVGIAFLTAASLALYPPLFAHAHYNSKDTFFLSMVVFCLWFFVQFFRFGKTKDLLWLALCTGISATVRLHAVFVFFSIGTGILFITQIIPKKRWYFLGLYALLSLLFFYVFFPRFWLHPMQEILELLRYSAANPWPSEILVADKLFAPKSMPWWYLILWIGVTLPLGMLVLLLFGFTPFIKSKNRQNSPFQIAIFLLFIFPMLYFILFRPTIYDGWRHMQFLLIPLVLIVGLGMKKLATFRFSGYLGGLYFLYNILGFLLWHPFGYAYMNELYAATGKAGTYEQDYWGLSANQALQWVTKEDQSDSISISSFMPAPANNALFLSKKDRKRFHFVTSPGMGKYEVEVRRSSGFLPLKGEIVYTICPLKDTLCRVVLLQTTPK